MTNDDLVERLAHAYNIAEDATQHGEDFNANGIRAVLVELAKMGTDALPSTDDIMRAWWSHDGPRGRDSAAIEHGVYNMLCSRVAPILAAKDAEIAKLMAHSEHLQRLLNDADATIEELRTKKGSES